MRTRNKATGHQRNFEGKVMTVNHGIWTGQHRTGYDWIEGENLRQELQTRSRHAGGEIFG